MKTQHEELKLILYELPEIDYSKLLSDQEIFNLFKRSSNYFNKKFFIYDYKFLTIESSGYNEFIIPHSFQSITNYF